MYSLFIDTHDKNVIIVLFKDGKIIDKIEETTINKHSVVTLPAIRNIIKNNNIDVEDLNEIIVVNGPGSFTGVRIAVTIGKTMAYGLNIPIKVIDSLKLLAVNVQREKKIVAIEDRNGAFVGQFDGNNIALTDYVYLGKNNYQEFKSNNEIIVDIDINYVRVYEYMKYCDASNVHDVKPLYVKGISALNDK